MLAPPGARPAGCPSAQTTLPLRAGLDEALADGEGHRVRAVLQPEARGHVVDHVLDRALRVAEPARDLAGLVPLGDEAEHRRLALGETREGDTAGVEHLSLEPPDLVEQPREQVAR